MSPPLAPEIPRTTLGAPTDGAELADISAAEDMYEEEVPG